MFWLTDRYTEYEDGATVTFNSDTDPLPTRVLYEPDRLFRRPHPPNAYYAYNVELLDVLTLETHEQTTYATCRQIRVRGSRRRLADFTVPDPARAAARCGNILRYARMAGRPVDAATETAAVTHGGASIQHITDPTLEMQITAVECSGDAISYIPDPPESLVALAVQSDPAAVLSVPELYERYAMRVVTDSPQMSLFYGVRPEDVASEPAMIQYMYPQTETAQLRAVSADGALIRYCREPSAVVQRAAIEQTIGALVWIREPDEDIQIAAIQAWGAAAVPLLHRLTEAAQLEAAVYSYEFLRWTPNPSEAVQIATARCAPESLALIEHPTEAAQLTALYCHGAAAVAYLRCPSAVVQMAALAHSADFLTWCTSPDEVQMAAVRADPFNLFYIPQPCQAAVDLAAVRLPYITRRYAVSEAAHLPMVRHNGMALGWIRGASAEVQRVAVRACPHAIRWVPEADRAVEMLEDAITDSPSAGRWLLQC